MQRRFWTLTQKTKWCFRHTMPSWLIWGSPVPAVPVLTVTFVCVLFCCQNRPLCWSLVRVSNTAFSSTQTLYCICIGSLTCRHLSVCYMTCCAVCVFRCTHFSCLVWGIGPQTWLSRPSCHALIFYLYSLPFCFCFLFCLFESWLFPVACCPILVTYESWCSSLGIVGWAFNECSLEYIFICSCQETLVFWALLYGCFSKADAFFFFSFFFFRNRPGICIDWCMLLQSLFIWTCLVKH